MIVETGLKEPGANSYIDIAFADNYHLTYGNDTWVGTDEEKAKALISACQSLDLLYGPKYLSNRLEGNQDLLWPRYPFVDRNGNSRIKQEVPIEVKKAQAEIALMYLNGTDLFPEGNDAGRVESESIKVGDIQTTTTYSKTTKPDLATYEGFRKIDLLLWNVTKGRQTSFRMSR